MAKASVVRKARRPRLDSPGVSGESEATATTAALRTRCVAHNARHSLLAAAPAPAL